MSERYPGGIITKTPVTPTGPYQNGTAPGVWTLDQQLQFQQQGIWPTAGLLPNYIEDVFSTYLYTGTDAAQTIINGIDLAGKGGLVWGKSRSASQNHRLYDTARGSNYSLISNDTAAQSNQGTNACAFNANGFSLSAASGIVGSAGFGGPNYVSWTFRKQAKFFDVVTYTGNGSSTQTITHNLGSTPGCIIAKGTSGLTDWPVYHSGLNGGTNPEQYYLRLNATSAQSSAVANWGDTAPTSTTFTVGANNNVNGLTYVAYLFASNAGGFGNAGTDNVITCGSFTTDASGNASVNLGYEPQFWLYKPNLNARYWTIYDTMRGWSQTYIANLNPNVADAEGGGAATLFYPTATGFDCVGSALDPSTQHIYIAIRRGPMATPTDATKVFSPNQTSGTTGTPITTNFPIDFQMLGINAGNVYNQRVSTRLTGVNTNGTSNSQYLVTSNTNAEAATGSVTLNWGSTGFQVPSLNSGSPTIFWNFQRAPGFFDEVCYTGTGSDPQTVSHNLGVPPELIIVKARNAAASWVVWGGNMNIADYMNLNSSNAVTTGGASFFGGTMPTSSVFYASSGINVSARTEVAYLFATCAGVSKVGSYTGNGTTQTINCGFGAGGVRFVLIKRTDSTGDWYTYDTARGMTTLTDPYLLLNSTAAEVATLGSVTTVSTGFALNSSILAAINVNGGSYIFLAIS